MRLDSERLFVDAGGRCEEVETAVLILEFDYGGVKVAAGDPLDFVPRETGRLHRRDRRAEAEARRILEGLGAVEIDCLEDAAAAPDSRADYVLHLDGDVHELCAFSAYAVPELEAQGFEVKVAPDYRWRAVAAEAPWFADVAEGDEREDWFGLELGVDVEGERINLLPALLDLLDKTRDLESLRRSMRRCIAVPAGERGYVPVPPERLRLLLDVLLELYRGGESSPEIPLARAGALARLGLAFDDAPDKLRWQGATEIRDRGYTLALGPSAPKTPEPEGLRATLRPYQREGVAWLRHLREHDAGGILADDMGLGKTLQTIAHLLEEKESGRMEGPMLVVAPTSLLGNWKRELSRFAPALRVLVLHGARRKERFSKIDHHDVIVTSYPLLVRDKDVLSERTYHLVVLDEAHQIKNPSSLTHAAACAIPSRRRLCLTGTPIENHLGEMWALFHFLMPGFLASSEQFRARFRAPIEQLGDASRLEVLRDSVKPYILRRTKVRVASDLPPKTELVRAVELSGRQRELYESIRIAAHARVRSAIRQRGFGGSTVTVLDALLKLRQVCCDPNLVGVEAARGVEESAKLELLCQLVRREVEEGRKILVFSQFTRMLELIGQQLTAAGHSFVELTGATRDRQAKVDSFQRGEVDLFLISLKAGGCGLNLTAADTVVHYDPWWNPAAQAQASDRAHRIGQDKPVFVYNLIAAGSVEERMLRLQSHKRRLADAILAPRKGPALSEREVDDLFAPLDR